MEKGNKKIINAWAFYDWANSAYPLVITSTIFPIYYENITKTETSDIVTFLGFQFKNTALYTYSLSFAFLLIAVLSPILSGIADYGGIKKRFMQFFCYMGAISCSAMYFFTAENLWFGILLIILASIGYSGSIVFYNAFLPEIAAQKDQDKVSAKGFALGYLGSSLLLIFNLTLILMPQWYGEISKDIASRTSFLITGIWWFIFAQYPFYYLSNNFHKRKSEENLLFKGYKELKKVWEDLKHNKTLTRYLTAFFVYNMGVQTVMLVAVLFGTKEIGMESGELITTILIIQFIAIGGAYLFSHLAQKKGNIKSLQLATLIWVLICIMAYFVQTAAHFYFLALAVGLVMGGIQSVSRSTYSKMLPETIDHASYFSFYDICEKLGIVMGMALFGMIEELSDSMRNPVITLMIFFLVGFILLFRIPKENIDS